MFRVGVRSTPGRTAVVVAVVAIAVLATLATTLSSARSAGSVRLRTAEAPAPLSGAAPPGGVAPLNFSTVLNLVDDRLVPGGSEAPVLSDPVNALYDPVNDMVYVRGSGGDLLSVLSVASDRVVDDLGVPAEEYPEGYGTPTMAVDPVNGTVYVAGSSGRVDIVDPTSNKVIGSYAIGVSATGIAFDAEGPTLYVSEWSLDRVVAIDVATGQTTLIGVGSEPGDILVTPSTVYVANFGSSNVSLLSPGVNDAYAAAPTGAGPLALANDSVDGEIAVVDSGSDALTILSDDYPSVAEEVNVTVGSDPVAIGYDPGNDDLYVANNGSNNVSIVDGSTGASSSAALGPGSDPVAVYLGENGADVAVLDAGDDSVTMLSNTSSVPVATVALTGGSSYAAAVVGAGQELVAVSTGNYSIPTTTGVEAQAAVLGISPAEIRDTVPLQVFPAGVTYDPANDQLLVADPAGDEVYEVDPATEGVVANVSGGAYPTATGYDPASNTVYVLDANGTVTFLANGTTLADNGSTALGAEPTAFAEDPTIDDAFVSLSDGSLAVFNATTNQFVSDWPVQPGADLASMVYDPLSQRLFIAPGVGQDELDVVDVAPGHTDKLLADVAVGPNPGSVALDPNDDAVFVANWGATPSPAGSVSVVSGTQDTVLKTIGSSTLPAPGNLTFDNATDDLVNAELGSGAVDTVNASTYASATPEFYLGSLSNTSGIAYAPTDFGVFVTTPACGSVAEFTNATEYPIAFTEAGLPTGTAWQVDLEGSHAGSSTSFVNFTALNGSYAFSIGKVAGYAANVTAGTVRVAGASVAVPITFASTAARDFPVNFNETGLPSGTLWSATLNGSSASSSSAVISFSEPNATYAYTVGAVAGYSANVTSGSLTVNGSGVNVSVGFVPAPGPSYYAVNFTESGLTPGTRWQVALNGTALNSTSPTIEFVEPDGTYAFDIGAVAGYATRVSTGSLTVRGGPLTVPVAFAPTVLFNVSFVETGLPGGTAWSVSLDGASPVLASAAVLNFSEPNATYTFSVGAVAGYSVSPGNGSFSVTGRAIAIDVTYAASGAVASTSPTLLAAVIGVGVILIIVVLVGVLFSMGRRGKSPPVFENDVLATGPNAAEEWDDGPSGPRS